MNEEIERLWLKVFELEQRIERFEAENKILADAINELTGEAESEAAKYGKEK